MKIDSFINSNYVLCVDTKSADEINKFLNSKQKNLKKLRMIIDIINRRHNSKSHYEVYRNIGSGNVSAMKFNSGNDNARIYCQLRDTSPQKIIMAIFLAKKKDQSISKKFSKQLEQLSKYEYKEFKIEKPK